ncbi:hypothetical protein PIB30_006852 [Stylosanthes scabra]|uniref:Uncharacterized protein n=1 Tax=Stylosanthes scabra TaxID=79078 RepID=A0ABU6V2P2_9FABA|nr:hypothetical protein [Stylosanthes scabra]
MAQCTIEEIAADDRRVMYRLNRISHVAHNVDPKLDGSQVYLDLNEPVSGPSQAFIVLGGTPPSAAHGSGGSWEVPFMASATVPTPPGSPHWLSSRMSQQHAGGPADFHVVEDAALEAIYSLYFFLKRSKRL